MKKKLATLTTVIITSVIISSCTRSTTHTPSTLFPAGGMFTASDIYNDNTLSGSTNDSTGIGAAQAISMASIGNVTINGFAMDGFYGQYSTTGASTVTINPFVGKPTWSVTGGSGYGAFTYTTVKSMPHVNNLHINLTSFNRSANLVLMHATITADTIKYSIVDDNGTQVIKSVSGSSSGFTFTPAMLATLSVSSDATLQILGSVGEYSLQGGKNILFVSASEYNRSGISIN